MSLPVPVEIGIARPSPRRPDGVTMLGISAVLAGGMLVFAVIALAFPSNPRSYGTDLMGFWIVLIFGYVGVARLVPVMFFSIIFISALLYFVAGIGFFWGRPYAWILGIALACFGIASSMIQLVVWPIDYWLFVSPGLFSTSFILYYLTRSDVRNFFGGKALTTPPDYA